MNARARGETCQQQMRLAVSIFCHYLRHNFENCFESMVEFRYSFLICIGDGTM